MSHFRRRQWQPTPVLLPGKSHGRRSLVGCSPWGREELDTTERLHCHFSLSCIGEGNGNPLQCSCLENPRDGGAWWAAVYGVAQSRTRLKRLSSSSSRSLVRTECVTTLRTTASTCRLHTLAKGEMLVCLAQSCFMPDSRQIFQLETLVTLKNVLVWKNIIWTL